MMTTMSWGIATLLGQCSTVQRQVQVVPHCGRTEFNTYYDRGLKNFSFQTFPKSMEYFLRAHYETSYVCRSIATNLQGLYWCVNTGHRNLLLTQCTAIEKFQTALQMQRPIYFYRHIGHSTIIVAYCISTHYGLQGPEGDPFSNRDVQFFSRSKQADNPDFSETDLCFSQATWLSPKT